MELLKQGQYTPYPMEEQVISMWLGTSGRLDDVPTLDVPRFESEFLDFLKRENPGILESIREAKVFDDDTSSALEQVVTRFEESFQTSEGQLLKVGSEEFEALPDEDVEQEKIVRQKRG
jgi:F-type H+-transporting ATPase subunit alpha